MKISDISLVREKLESVMPEVHKQVALYEYNLKNGNLKTIPKSNISNK
jgi:hypothetical protein